MRLHLGSPARPQPRGCCAHQGRQRFLDRTAALQRKQRATSKDSTSPTGFLEGRVDGRVRGHDHNRKRQVWRPSACLRALQQSWLSDLPEASFPGGSGRICSSQRACPCIFMASKANTQRITSLQVANDSTDGRVTPCGKVGSSSRSGPEQTDGWAELGGRARARCEPGHAPVQPSTPQSPPRPPQGPFLKPTAHPGIRYSGTGNRRGDPRTSQTW